MCTTAICLQLTGCGIIANHKPIPSGSPTASIHFGPMRGGFRSQGVHVNDRSVCHPVQFARYHAIGSYLGSDLNVEIPANMKLFVTLGNSQNGVCSQGLCTRSCTSSVSFSPKAGAGYHARLAYQDAQESACAVVITILQNGAEVPVETQAEKERCIL